MALYFRKVRTLRSLVSAKGNNRARERRIDKLSVISGLTFILINALSRFLATLTIEINLALAALANVTNHRCRLISPSCPPFACIF